MQQQRRSTSPVEEESALRPSGTVREKRTHMIVAQTERMRFTLPSATQEARRVVDGEAQAQIPDFYFLLCL